MDRLIIAYLINTYDSELPSDISNIKYDLVIHGFFSNFYKISNATNIHNREKKYTAFKILHQKQTLMMSNDYEKAMNIFTKYQRILFAIDKCKQIFRRKFINSTFDYTCDMQLNELSTYPKHRKITISQNKTNYTFALNDLIKIIHTAVTNVENLVHYPYKPKNPFTNIEFDYVTLCNIYIALLNSNIKIRTHILDYFYMNFNVNSFMEKYKIYVLERYVKNERFEISPFHTYTDLIEMYDYAREDLQITTCKLSPYNRVDNYYIEHLKNHCKLPLYYFFMSSIIPDIYTSEMYIKKFIKTFKKVNYDNPGLNKFSLFNKRRLQREKYSLFNKKNTNTSLFGLDNEQIYVVNLSNIETQTSTDVNDVNVNDINVNETTTNNIFGPNPFV